VFQDLDDPPEDPKITNLLDEMCSASANENPLKQTNNALLKMELKEATTMEAARKSLKGVLEERDCKARGFGSKKNLHSF